MLLAFRQFMFLVWKGSIMRKRRYFVTLFEVVIPLGLVALFMFLRTLRDPQKGGEIPAVIPPTFDPLEYVSTNPRVLFTPDNGLARNLTFGAFSKLHIHDIRGVVSEDVLYSEALGMELNRSDLNDDIFGLVYDRLDLLTPRKVLQYKLRINNNMGTSEKYPTLSFNGPANADNAYINSGFLAVQAAIDKTFMEMISSDRAEHPNLIVKMQKFPYPSYYSQQNSISLFSFIPMIISLGYSVIMSVFVKRIVMEKLNRAKEMMRMMGLNDFVYFSGTFCNTFFLLFATLTLTTILFKIPISNGLSVVNYADGSLLWILFLLYAFNGLLFCMAFSAFFNKPVVAAILTYFAWTGSFSLPRFLMDPPGNERMYKSLSLGAKLSSCLLPNAAIHWAFKCMSFYEGLSEGSNWKNMSIPSPGDDLSLSLVMWMMVLSSVLYSFVLWYVDNVWPWQFGIPKHPLFLFMPSYWCPRKSKMSGYEDFEGESNLVDQTYFEDGPRNRLPGIVVSSLTKVFGWGSGRKVAVNDVSLTMYRGQITALLGHNGAGKTTTINVITGLYAPTSGTAVVNGCDILNNLKGARQSLGLCPQHNVLYDILTVEEHLTFFAGLKGRTFQEMKPEIDSCLELLQLENKRHEQAKTLSGGMKRKLSLGIAMIGGSEVLILDEPTSGMDPQARRAIWDLLQRIREDRTIVLTTHYMEEADILGDRIAIMAEGMVQCCGSPLFLKRKFGAGYHLRISKGAMFNEQEMTCTIQESVPSAYVDTDMRTEISYVLPVTNSQSFVTMFESLELNKEKLGFTSCGLTITTMEDVFIKVGQLAETTQNIESNDHQISDSNVPSFHVKLESRLRGPHLLFQQVRGLLTKRFHDAKRYWIFLIFLIFLPLAILFLMILLRNHVYASSQGDTTPLKLDLGSVFGPTDAYYNSTNNTKIESYYRQVLESTEASPMFKINVSGSVLDEAKSNLDTYQNKLLVGGQLNQTIGDLNVVAMYSEEVYHASGMALNLMDVAILRTLTNDSCADIVTINSPLSQMNQISQKMGTEVILDFGKRLIFTFVFPLALSLLSASFVLFPIHERTTKSKLIQLMTGVNGMTFWTTHFLWDYLMHFISSCFMVIPFVVLDDKKAYAYGSGATGTLFLMLILYGWSSIPLSYILSFITRKPATGFAVAAALNFVTGMIATAGVTFYRFYSLVISKSVAGANAVAWVCRLLPNFAVTWGAANLDSLANHNAYCDILDPKLKESICREGSSINPYFKCCPDKCGSNCFEKQGFFTMDEASCGRDMLFMFMSGFFYFFILALTETNLIRFWYRSTVSKSKQQQTIPFASQNGITEDSDVAAERSRVEYLYEQGRGPDEALVVSNLQKNFGKLNAVDQLTFSVHKDECFGLLGVNGAGKTTTFSMLTGDLTIGKGNAYIDRYSVKDHLKEFQWHVGYCPQFDAILDRLTGHEALFLFARLRGVPEADIPSTVDKLIEVMDLQAHAHKIAETYSGGNRRKLSLAMSLVGSPPVVFLDEPTAGVDPASRRKIWTALSRVQATGGTSFILTTHSMEECEALCGRLAIMVNGQFRCLGGIQYLKNKFGQGYTIIVKLNKDQHLDPIATESVKNFFELTFPGSLLKDLHQGMLHYHIADNTFSRSHLFREMEGAKLTFDLEDYLISDTTLEQIFLTFARTQRIVSST